MEKKNEIFAGVAAPEDEKIKTDNVVLTEENNEVRYKVYGQDILIKDDLIKEFYKVNMKLLTYANLLVGRFDDQGNYIIPKEIKRDLVVMDKEIDDEGDSFFKATNVYMKKNFYYYIKISQLGDGKAKAALYLYEYVGDFLDKDFIVSHVANFEDVFDQDFRGKLRKAFNLVDVDVPNDDLTTPNLAVLMQRMLDERARTWALYEMACQSYVMRILKMLEDSGEYGEKYIKEYKKLLAKAGGKASWIKQKALLDRVVNKFGGYERMAADLVDTKALFEEAVKTNQEIERRKAAVEVEKAQKEEEKKKEEKKAAAKKAATKKAAPKAAGKAAGKKAAAKKKEEKKPEKKKGGGVSEAEFADIPRKIAAMLAARKNKNNSAKDKEEKPVKEEKQKEKQKEEKEQEEKADKVETPIVNEDDFSMQILTAEQQEVREGGGDEFAAGGQGQGSEGEQGQGGEDAKKKDDFEIGGQGNQGQADGVVKDEFAAGGQRQGVEDAKRQDDFEVGAAGTPRRGNNSGGLEYDDDREAGM